MRDPLFAQNTPPERAGKHCPVAPWLFGPLLLVAWAQAASQASAHGGGHSVVGATQIIVRLKEEPGTTPSPALIAQIGHSAAVRLVFIRSTGPHLYVFSLTATDSDPSCSDALTRLRQNAGIGSVDVDAHGRTLD